VKDAGLGARWSTMAGIREDVEKKIYEMLSEVGDRLGAERLQQIVEGALSGAARTKEAVDKNFGALLSLANIPSRREYDRMRVKLDALQGSVMNLTRMVEDLRARSANGAAAATSARKTSARKTTRRRKVKRSPRTKRGR
jgi:hypothetical protein